MLASLKSLVVLALLAQLTTAFHFYLKTGESKCFFEDLEKDTLVVGRIEAFDRNDEHNVYSRNPNLKVQITVDETFDNNHRVVDQRSAPSGEFAFTSFDSGEHKFCLTPRYNDGSTGKTHRIFFDVAVGSSHDYVDSKSTKQVDSLTSQVLDLNKKLSTIHFEQEHLREREARFRDSSETTNSHVVRWSIVQVLVLVGTCVYQLRHLKGFFVKQKIV